MRWSATRSFKACSANRARREVAEVLAHHYTQTDRAGKAFTYLSMARTRVSASILSMRQRTITPFCSTKSRIASRTIRSPNSSCLTRSLTWVHKAQAVAGIGEAYQGRSSAYWYDAAQFHELLLACGPQPVRNLTAQLDGCSGGKAGEIVAVAGLDRRHCQNIDRQQAATLLTELRRSTRPVSADRLGHVGRRFPRFSLCQ
jgi:hypothetical protein